MAYLTFMWVWSVVTFLATILVLIRFHNEHNGNGCQDSQGGRTPNASQEKHNPGTIMLSSLRQTLGACFTRLGGAASHPNSMTMANQVQPTLPAVSSRQPNKEKNFGEEPADRSTSFCQGQQEDAAIATHAHHDSCRAMKKSDLGVSAKTLDCIFFIRSLVIVTAIDTAVIIMGVLFKMK